MPRLLLTARNHPRRLLLTQRGELTMPKPTPMPEKYVRVPWECKRCRTEGTAPRIYLRPHENRAQAALRFQAQTRTGCVQDCQFTSLWRREEPPR